MRKILSGFLATAMIVSVGSMATMAATPASKSAVVKSGTLTDLAAAVDTVTEVILTVNGKDYSVSLSKAGSYTTGSTAGVIALAEDLKGTTFTNVDVNGKYYDLKLGATINGTTNVTFDATFSPAADLGTDPTVTLTIKGTNTGTAAVALSAVSMTIANGNKGTGGTTADVTIEGTDILDVKDVVMCDGQGNPIPMTEGKVAVGEDLNGQNGVQSGNTLYFMIKDGDWKFYDDSFWNLRLSKGDNGKYVKKLSDVTKNFSKPLYNAVNGAPMGDETKGRHRFIKVELNEIFTDDEYKITLDMRFTPKSAAENQFKIDSDTELKVKDFSFWMKNMVKDADNDWKVGIGGLMLNPLENDWNEVTYFDEDGDLAFMKFFADSDVSKFYAKLSTKWEHADYASYFNDQDAYIFDFVGSPKISATSRCDLEIYNPFVNENGDETIDPSTAVIYQVIDGDLFDVTDSFEYKEGQNGDMAYTTRTRFLGTYIICEKAVEEAVDNTEEVPADLVPEDTAPEVVTPDTNNGGKAPANTGKYL